MKKYYCDVCGAELEGGGSAAASPAAELCGLEDLCPRCDGLAQGLDVSGLALAELRRLAGPGPEAPAVPAVPTPAAVPAPRGKAAREKREILAAVEAYRKEAGPGSISKLAKLAKVGEAELRDMLACTPLPIAVWRKVGRALGAASPAARPEAAP